jgi:SlyX protein
VNDHDARLEDLETRVAYQEDTIQQLNDALVRQQDRIDRVETMLRLLVEQMRAGDELDDPLAEPPPPHY